MYRKQYMMQVMTIGGATYDIFLHDTITPLSSYTDQTGNPFLLIPQGRKIECARTHYATGGGATNVAVAMRRLGTPVSAVFVVGNDSHAEYIFRELTTAQVTCSYAVRLPHGTTDTSVIIASPTKENSLFVHHGASNQMQPAHIPWDAFEQYPYLYIAPLPVAALLPKIVRHARDKKSFIAVNPGNNQLYVSPQFLYESLAGIDCLILNTSEAIQLFCWLLIHKKLSVPQKGMSNYASAQSEARLYDHFCTVAAVAYKITDYLKLIHSLGPRIVIVTDGAYGVYVGVGSGFFFHESPRVAVCNTVGAGDALSGTFIASIAHNYSIEQAIVRGMYNSSSVLQAQDAKSGLLTADQLDRLTERHMMDTRLRYFEY